SLTFTLDTSSPVVSESLASGTPANTTSAAVTGSGDANAVVHFTIDGSPVASTTTADSSGHWSFTPTGLAIGSHTIVASETDLAGNSGQVSLSFNLQAQIGPPAFTSIVDHNGTVTVTGSTGEAGDTVSLYDGNNWLGQVTTGSGGNWTYSAHAAP